MQSLLLLGTVTLALSSEVTPIQKVIQLMDNMKKKGTKEMVDEQAQFGAYKLFCETTLKEKGQAIEEATDKMDTLEADIEKAEYEARRMNKEIAAHATDIEKNSRKAAEATALRKTEKADFKVELMEFQESISALERALDALKTSDSKVSISLVQLMAVRNLKNIPGDALARLDVFLDQQRQQQKQQPPVALVEKSNVAQAPQPKIYESQSGGVVTVLEELLDKFVDQRVELEKEEAKKQHAYDLLAQGLSNQLQQSTKDKADKTGDKAKTLEAKAGMQADLEETSQSRSSDQKYKDDLTATCAKKASAFDARQKMRKEELEAIDKAQELIGGKSVAGNAEKHASLLQTRRKSSALAVLRLESQSPKQQEVARFLQEEAKKLNSRVLAAAAVRSRDDSFEKIKVMLEGLITKMQKQMNEEATKKGWCDTELAQNKDTRENKDDLVDTLTSDIDELSSSISTLKKEILTLGKDITGLTTAMRKSTELRLQGKNKNAATIRDAKEAQAAVAQALTVLKEFYAKANDATAFIQQASKAGQPEIFGDETYTGRSEESGGVISMMELIETDFARLEAETSADEEAGKKEFDEFMEDSKIDKATKAKDTDFKNGEKQHKEQELKIKEDDLLAAHKEQDAANAYFDKLKEKCLASEESAAEEKARREKEIADLKEALNLLISTR